MRALAIASLFLFIVAVKAAQGMASAAFTVLKVKGVFISKKSLKFFMGCRQSPFDNAVCAVTLFWLPHSAIGCGANQTWQRKTIIWWTCWWISVS
jgi:hypothetical protein